MQPTGDLALIGLAVMGEKRLVSGHDMFAREQSGFGGVFGRAIVATHHLDKDIDIGAAFYGDR